MIMRKLSLTRWVKQSSLVSRLPAVPSAAQACLHADTHRGRQVGREMLVEIASGDFSLFDYLSSRLTASAGFSARNTADPATKTSAPASITAAAVSGLMPPSTSISAFIPLLSRAARR